MDFVDCYDDPVISDRDSPPTILQEPTVLQEEIIELPCAKPTPITNQKPKILSKTTAGSILHLRSIVTLSPP